MDRELPHSKSLEEAVLGTLLLKPTSLLDVMDLLHPHHFYNSVNGQIYEAILQLDSVASAIDVVTTHNQLHKNGVTIDGAVLIALQANTPSTNNAFHYAKQIVELANKRQLVLLTERLSKAASSKTESFQKVLAQAESELFSFSKPSENKEELFIESLENWREKFVDPNQENGLKTPWIDINKHLHGLSPKRLIVIAARPAMGKSSIANALALSTAQQGLPTLFVSLEMSREELITRLISSISQLPSDRILPGKISGRDMPHIDAAIETLSSLPLQIEELNNVSLPSLRAVVRRSIRRQGGLSLIIVDYLQLMHGSRKENRQQDVAEIAEGLKIISREFNVPVVALSQLSRSCESRGYDKRPTLADLRESGAIEQAADQVLMLYRDEVYYPDSTEKGVAEIIINKNRHGSIGTVKLTVDLATGSWRSFAPSHV